MYAVRAAAGRGARRRTRPGSSPNSQLRARIRCGRGISRSFHGPVKWTYYYLYSIIDIFSRYTVGWMVAPAEWAALAEKLLGETKSPSRTWTVIS